MKLLNLISKSNWCVLLTLVLLSVVAIINVLSWDAKKADNTSSNDKSSDGKSSDAVQIGLIKTYNESIFENLEDTQISLGSSSFIKGINVHGAIVMTGHHLPPKYADEFVYLNRRIANARAFVRQLPFPVTEWSGVFTRPCPHWPKSPNLSERGVTWAHYRIWQDFAYFDPFLIEEHKLNKSTYTTSTLSYNGKSIKSSDGLYEIFQDGTMFKNGQRYSDSDILAIFEDDAEIAIKDFNTTLYYELTHMTTDLVLLGFTHCKYFKDTVPLTTHAYALTRAGAKKYMKYYEPCGATVDLQYIIMDHAKHMSIRKAFDSSYMKSYLVGKPKAKPDCGETQGLVIQNKKDMGSVNGHVENVALRFR